MLLAGPRSAAHATRCKCFAVRGSSEKRSDNGLNLVRAIQAGFPTRVLHETWLYRRAGLRAALQAHPEVAGQRRHGLQLRGERG